jgi:internalin A
MTALIDKQAWAEAEWRVDIAKQTQASALNLSGLGLSRLPRDVWSLKSLRRLLLGDNELTQLPVSIGKLQNLQELVVRGNLLRELPDAIGRLYDLRTLDASRNRLAELPAGFCALRSLRELRLGDNRLRAIPPCVGEFSQLRQLQLQKNRLERVPIELQQIPNLQGLYLHDNGELGLPPEILGSTWDQVIFKRAPRTDVQQIFRYLFALRDSARPLNEAKLILVGRGGVGKTSLRKRLTLGEFEPHEDKTAGIQVTAWPLIIGTEPVKMNIWDFGGQEIMHATHQFFLTRRSLYVLVLNAREGKQDSNIEYWLRLIEAYSDNSPTLVVVNKCDQHPLDLAETLLTEKFPFIRGFVATDCLTGFGITELQEAIEMEANHLADLRTPFPSPWLSVKQNLETLADDCITYDDYGKLCQQQGESDVANQQVLISFLHDLGTVLYFREDTRLNDLGVLKPAWVTEGIYGLLNSNELKSAGGVLSTERLGTLLAVSKYPKHRHDFLLRLMERFELCFELPHTSGSKFLIPELLPEEPITLPSLGADVLGFEYHYNVLPEGLLPRFIVRTHALSEDGPRWRSGVLLRQGAAQALVRADVQDKLVWIAVRGPGRQPRELLAVVRSNFEEIHRGISRLTAEEQVPVPNYPQVKLDYRKLLVREANGKKTVEFETETDSIELPLSKLLDNFEEPDSRRERATIIVQAGGKIVMNAENCQDFSGAVITNSVVGAHLQNIANAIRQIPADRANLRAALEELNRHSQSLLRELPKDLAEETAANLEDFTREATKDTPRKSFLEVTSKGLIEASTTIAAIAPPIIETVQKILSLVGN